MRTDNKQVIAKVQEHVLSYFTSDMGWNNDNSTANLTEQINSMRIGNENNYMTGLHLVEGGTFLIYYQEQEDFLNSLGINPENKKYSNQQVWDLYKHLLAREIQKLVNSQVYA
jgi:hypothetical protein